MGITYSAGAGTQITSPAMTEVLPDQTQQSGNNTVIVSDLLSVIGGGQIGDGSSGSGDSYLNRLIIVNQDTVDEQIRVVTADAAGTGTTRILTVNEDWVTNPVITADSIWVAYELADIEDGGAGGGIALSTRTGLWEFGRILTINATGILAAFNGQAMELADRGASLNMLVEADGFFYAGYIAAGSPISGIELISYNNSAGEPSVQVDADGHFLILDTLIWSQLVPMSHDIQVGAIAVFKRVKWLTTTEELTLYDADIDDSSIAGKGTATEIVRVDDGVACNGLVISNIESLDSRADTVAETIVMTGVQFVGVALILTVRSNKIWEMVNPIWDVTVYTDLNWITGTANAVNDRRSVTVTVQESDGTLLQDAVVNIYENTQTDDLVLELVTDVNGFAQNAFIFREHLTDSVTNTYGGHALQVGKWLYLPFVAAQPSDELFNGVVVLSPDPDIAETDQATAITAGSTITWNEDANPSELFAFTGGAGTLEEGMILTFDSGAVGTITASMSGNSTAGEIHLSDRNGTAIANGDDFSRTGGTAGTFSGTYTDDTGQPFSIWIDILTLGLQVGYDLTAAIMTETTLGPAGEIVWEWCRDQQTQPLYATGVSFFTERSYGKGIILVHPGAGAVDYYTDDNGDTWTPPSNVEHTVFNLRTNDRVIWIRVSDGAELQNLLESAGTATYAYVYSGDVDVYVQVLSGDNTRKNTVTDVTLGNSDEGFPAVQANDTVYFNP